MQIRRQMMGVIAQMASGADYVSGEYTVPDTGDVIFSFGKTFNKYFYYLEMTDESKEDLMDSGINAIRTFCTCGVYPQPKVNNVEITGNRYQNYRVTPSTGEVTSSVNGSSSPISSIDSQSITFNASDFSSGAYILYRGSTYKYFVVEMK